MSRGQGYKDNTTRTRLQGLDYKDKTARTILQG